LLCARQNTWCCRFHVSRDSIKAMQHSLIDEEPAILGHNQWVWYPEEVIRHHRSSIHHNMSVPYRFVHFYRDPLQKLLSGYRYHKDGVESWTRRSKPFAGLCNSSLAKLALETDPLVRVISSAHQVNEHCRASYLCQSCCRREHENTSLHFSVTEGTEGTDSKSNDTSVGYISRHNTEYQFLCAHLGSVHPNSTLSDVLAVRPRDNGLLIEAALDYYENLRMARIVNHTWHDPNT